MVSSENHSSRSISPSSPQSATIRSTSRGMVTACCRMCSPRRAVLWSISDRRSGLASNTTPSPNTGVMNG